MTERPDRITHYPLAMDNTLRFTILDLDAYRKALATVTVECRRCGYTAEGGSPEDLFTIAGMEGAREIVCPNCSA